MGVQTYHGEGPQPLMWGGSCAARGKITINGTPTRLNYCVIHTHIAYTQFTHVGAGRITQPGGPRVGDPWCRPTCHEEQQIPPK
jgi:hypothetical protein